MLQKFARRSRVSQFSTFTRPLGLNVEEIRQQFGEKPKFNVDKMRDLLDHDNLDTRQRLREFLRVRREVLKKEK